MANDFMDPRWLDVAGVGVKASFHSSLHSGWFVGFSPVTQHGVWAEAGSGERLGKNTCFLPVQHRYTMTWAS